MIIDAFESLAETDMETVNINYIIFNEDSYIL